MRRTLVWILTLLLLCGCAAQSEPVQPVQPSVAAESVPAPAEPEPVKGFRVEGTQLLDANGVPFLIRGVNHPHSWFPEEDETALRAMADLGCNTVRIVCGCGIIYPKDTPEDLIRLTDLCRELEMVAILEVHDITGDNFPASLEQVADYWISVREALIGREEWVILNIANEWKGLRRGRDWSAAYSQVIPRLRESGIRNAILVDAAEFGQYGTSLGTYGPTVLEADPDRNTLFAVHLYETAGKNAGTIAQNLSSGREAGLCVLVGEFGPSHQGKDIDEAAILEYCHQESIGYLGWSWTGNAPGNEQLDISYTWDGSELTDWGEFLFHSEYAIGNSSKKCTIFASFPDIG